MTFFSKIHFLKVVCKIEKSFKKTLIKFFYKTKEEIDFYKMFQSSEKIDLKNF